MDHISFNVEAGEIVGYIGVNGAGKSTTIKMLTGVLLPTGGSARILGRDPHKQRVENARQIGVVFGQRTQLWWDLALIESLNLIARIYDIPPARFKQMLDQLIHWLDQDEVIYLCDLNGSERAGMLLACLFIEHGMTAQQALEEVDRMRFETQITPALRCPESQEQWGRVIGWEKRV